jgi:hypothetical protein
MDCMILGNGPSLLTAKLPDLPSSGCNYIGQFYQPTYYVCVDATVIRHDDIIYPTAKNAQIAFLRNFNTCDPQPKPLYDLPNVKLVTKKSYTFPGERTTTGCTTAYLMLKIAYYMDFDAVFLYGVDHTLEHFSTNWYPGNKPCLETRVWHYKLAVQEYKKAHKFIINRSAPSILDDIFKETLPSLVMRQSPSGQ